MPATESSVPLNVIQPGIRNFTVNMPADRSQWTDSTVKKAIHDQYGVPPGVQTVRMHEDFAELTLDLSGGCGASCRLPCCGAGCSCVIQ